MTATPPRILVIYAHPTPHRSRVNRRLADAARDVPHVTVHDLYETYPDFHIDVVREQALLAESDLIVFLHPIQWYSMPALLKEWLDVVVEFDWACGQQGALRGKAYWLAVTTGSPVEAYQHDGIHGRVFADFLPQFEQTASLCGMTWLPPYILHGAHHVAEEVLAEHVATFRQRLTTYPHWPNRPALTAMALTHSTHTLHTDRPTTDGT
jgi:glutathione-regulated potassium-efflux system ancillary protein KefF